MLHKGVPYVFSINREFPMIREAPWAFPDEMRNVLGIENSQYVKKKVLSPLCNVESSMLIYHKKQR